MDDLLRDLRVAACFLTRLPVPWPPGAPADALARSMRLFPLAGAGIGLAAGLVWALALWLGAPALVAALLALTALALLTGALHEDGLADVADGFGGGRSRERALEIMRDSRIGSYGTLALVLSVGLRAAALAALARDPWGGVAALAAAGAVSRATCPALLAWLRPARPDGLGAGAGRPPSEAVLTALGLALCFALLLLGLRHGLAALALAVLVSWALAGVARRRIGGQTGDVLGAAQQLAEVAVLCAAAAA
ncbi:adenosylcobinamide-GDP ribazoletransferase [Inquilinus limosus]|uniref:Adenosylcobinamide-GDP ribazoletransferase n=1 Tax=Inquilinus limosus TaxID=171674 RepID=A0A211ZPU6_9PROT|nr:adenosylcobinamide-GDP ribazoletransferase [Inquilinus limosus]OWJ67206.1 adenosylcobinamide-GDP ribazoletransferase [Inquilinus limosus]